MRRAPLALVWTRVLPTFDGSAFAESYWLLPGNIPGKCGLYAGGIKMCGTQSTPNDAEVPKGYGMSPISGLGSPAAAPATSPPRWQRRCGGSAYGARVLLQLSEWCLDERQGVLALDIVDVPNPQHVVQLLRGHFQWPGGGGCTGGWLWEGRRHRRVKGDMAFDLL